MFKETLIAPNLAKAEDGEVSNGRESLELKKDYLMTMRELDSLRLKPKLDNAEKMAKLEGLNNRIDSLIGENKGVIFDKIIKAKEQGNKEATKTSRSIDHILESYALETKLIELPDNLLAEILRPLNHQIRQAIFVQRDKLNLSQAARTYARWVEDSVLAFHVSSREIKDAKLLPGEGEDAVYFSTDIERLFNNTSAKYIYAFHIPKDKLASYNYGALDCFGKFKIGDEQGIDIEDSISIYSKGDHSYRQKVLDALGAKFATNYYAATDHGNAYMEQRKDG